MSGLERRATPEVLAPEPEQPRILTVVNPNKLRIGNRDITLSEYLTLLTEEGYTCVIADFKQNRSLQTQKKLEDAVTILVMGEKRQ